MSKFKFIDLFAGIGGFHLAMDSLGGECVFAPEIDANARKTYQHNFQTTSPELFEEDRFNDDIRNIIPEEIPDFDVLCATQGGHLVFTRAEKETLEYNLKAVDSLMPEIISAMLHEFFVNRTMSVKQNIANIHAAESLNKSIHYGDLTALEIKVKNLLVSILLGFFPSKKWDGNFESNGTIVIKENGDQVGFHLIEMASLKDYLFETIRFDTPSTSRHRYGSLFVEKDNQVFFKLNLQLRF